MTQCCSQTFSDELSSTDNSDVATGSTRKFGSPEKEGKSTKGKISQNKAGGKRKRSHPSTKQLNRFDGLPEEIVAQKVLPDYFATHLDILIIGFNPGLLAAHKGHHYAGPGNHFWKCLYMSGLIPEPFTASDDYKLLEYKIGFTNIVARATRGSADLTKQELQEGALVLLEKLKIYQPKIAVFNGKGIYEVFSGKKKFFYGIQNETIAGTNTVIWVMPSSSARCAQLPRAIDKVPFYISLKNLRDHLNGLLPNIDMSQLVFPVLTKFKNEITQS